MSNDNLSPSLASVLRSIPYEQVGKPGRRASERDRDNAAMELAGYIVVILKFGLPVDYREELLKRANKVRRSQGNGDVVFVAETASAIRAAAEPVPTKAAFEETEARLALLMQEPAQ